MLESIEMRVSIALVAAAVMTGACASPAPPETRQYELHGQILDLRPTDHEVLIKHGDIAGFMPGMTMPFKVEPPSLLEGKAVGDLVRATLQVGRERAWLSSLVKTGSAPVEESAAIPPAAFVTPLSPGAEAPTTSLVDHTGAPLSLADWRGHPVAVTFIYVRCPLPQFCPMLDRRFAEVQRALHADPALAARARLLSVSFDPDADTPARLGAHAEKLGADPDLWRFATAPRDTVDRFAAHFGVNVIREADGTITHNMRTTVLDGAGRVVNVYTGGDWTADDIVRDLREAAAR